MLMIKQCVSVLPNAKPASIVMSFHIVKYLASNAYWMP